MFEDKTLVCKDCGKEFVWTAGEQEFYASRGLRTSPSAASPAVMPARTAAHAATAVSARCSTLSAQLAARLARFPSSPVRIARSTALTASLA